MSASVLAPPDVRESERRDFAGVVQAWIRSLEQNATTLHLRGCHTFAGQCKEMATEARRVLAVLTE